MKLRGIAFYVGTITDKKPMNELTLILTRTSCDEEWRHAPTAEEMALSTKIQEFLRGLLES